MSITEFKKEIQGLSIDEKIEIISIILSPETKEKIRSEHSKEWHSLTTLEFLKGYSDSDDIYDKFNK